jgi:fructokinase
MLSRKHPVVCFGEILWDILPSGAVPGGAPMNVAYHLRRQGFHPALITRIGNDDNGRELVKIFSTFGVSTDFFQVDENYNTGKVYATPDGNNEMRYDIVKPVAWDFIITENRFHRLLTEADYFVYGSLAARSSASRGTLLQLLETAKTKVLDINLRPPHFSQPIVEELLKKADFLKLNRSELHLIAGWFSRHATILDQLHAIRERFQIESIVVTMGAAGSLFFYNGVIYEHPGISVPVADTVGSGDAFLAGLLGRLLQQASPGEALEFANALGAYVATQRGACPPYSLDQLHQLIKTNDNAVSKL